MKDFELAFIIDKKPSFFRKGNFCQTLKIRTCSFKFYQALMSIIK